MKTVYTSGCFDILHVGHLRFLQKARKLGDKLVVLLNSDKSVRALKGKKRPINYQWERKEQLLALGCIDEVIIFHDKCPIEILNRSNNVDVYVKSSEYVGNTPERWVVENRGGVVVYLPHDANYSTSKIIKQIRRK